MQGLFTACPAAGTLKHRRPLFGNPTRDTCRHAPRIVAEGLFLWAKVAKFAPTNDTQPYDEKNSAHTGRHPRVGSFAGREHSHRRARAKTPYTPMAHGLPPRACRVHVHRILPLGKPRMPQLASDDKTRRRTFRRQDERHHNDQGGIRLGGRHPNRTPRRPHRRSLRRR